MAQHSKDWNLSQAAREQGLSSEDLDDNESLAGSLTQAALAFKAALEKLNADEALK